MFHCALNLNVDITGKEDKSIGPTFSIVACCCSAGMLSKFASGYRYSEQNGMRGLCVQGQTSMQRFLRASRTALNSAATIGSLTLVKLVNVCRTHHRTAMRQPGLTPAPVQ